MVWQGNHSLSIFKPANIAPTFYQFFYWIPILHLLQLWNSPTHLEHTFNCNIHLTILDTTFYSNINKLQLSIRTIIRTGKHTQQPTYLPACLPACLPTYLHIYIHTHIKQKQHVMLIVAELYLCCWYCIF